MWDRAPASGVRRPGLQEGFHLLQCLEQAIHLIKGIINRERGTHSARNTERIHQRHGAVMAGAYCHALLVQQHAHIRRVTALQQEGQYTYLVGAMKRQKGDAAEKTMRGLMAMFGEELKSQDVEGNMPMAEAQSSTTNASVN